MYIHIKSVKWDDDNKDRGLPIKNIYIDDKGMGYDPADVCGGLHGCDVENCESDYVDELPDDVEEYATQYPYDHEDFDNGAVSYISKNSCDETEVQINTSSSRQKTYTYQDLAEEEAIDKTIDNHMNEMIDKHLNLK